MSTTQFITKQHVTYYWKVVRGDVRQDTTDVFDQSQTEGFWQYEQTPRHL